ncbi:unnamed protein product, partial [Ranitomeya imitator]
MHNSLILAGFTLASFTDGRAKCACAGAVAEDQKRTSWKEDRRRCSGPETPIRPDQQRDRPWVSYNGGLSTALQNAVDKPLMPHGNQGKHRVTKRGPALSYPMFTLVTSEDIAGSVTSEVPEVIFRIRGDLGLSFSLTKADESSCKKSLVTELNNLSAKLQSESLVFHVCRTSLYIWPNTGVSTSPSDLTDGSVCRDVFSFIQTDDEDSRRKSKKKEKRLQEKV